MKGNDTANKVLLPEADKTKLKLEDRIEIANDLDLKKTTIYQSCEQINYLANFLNDSSNGFEERRLVATCVKRYVEDDFFERNFKDSIRSNVSDVLKKAEEAKKAIDKYELAFKKYFDEKEREFVKNFKEQDIKDNVELANNISLEQYDEGLDKSINALNRLSLYIGIKGCDIKNVEYIVFNLNIRPKYENTSNFKDYTRETLSRNNEDLYFKAMTAQTAVNLFYNEMLKLRKSEKNYFQLLLNLKLLARATSDSYSIYKDDIEKTTKSYNEKQDIAKKFDDLAKKLNDIGEEGYNNLKGQKYEDPLLNKLLEVKNDIDTLRRHALLNQNVISESIRDCVIGVKRELNPTENKPVQESEPRKRSSTFIKTMLGGSSSGKRNSNLDNSIDLNNNNNLKSQDKPKERRGSFFSKIIKRTSVKGVEPVKIEDKVEEESRPKKDEQPSSDNRPQFLKEITEGNFKLKKTSQSNQK